MIFHYVRSGRRRAALPLLVCCLFGSSNYFAPPCCLAQSDQRPPATTSDAEQRYVEQVLPILREHCFECHSHESGEGSGQLMLDSLSAMQTGGSRGAAVVAGKAEHSLLVEAMEYNNPELQMPPEGQLPPQLIVIVKQWIAAGAHMPAHLRGTPKAGGDGDDPQLRGAAHWAYQMPVQLVSEGQSEQHPIDAILQAKLVQAGLQYSPRADRPTLIKRAYYDLIGLPPDIQEIRNFVNDPLDDSQAFASLVDRLLNSPHFGERWARYWMDIARYADNKGYVFQEDREYPQAYKYRDWLIAAFNRDMPYDEFVTQQLAADLVAKPDGQTEEEPGDLPALGFLTLGRRFLNNKLDIIDDRLDVVSRGLMGMTLTCARCHDHKYDPLTQKDYYALAGVFLNTDEPGDGAWPHRLQDSAENRQAFVLVRGSPGRRGEKVSRRFVQFLAPDSEPLAEQGSGRLELARRIASADNPLTSRVIANRIWLHLTGQSLVESPSDFGLRCPPPQQLELLDHLALELVAQDWSMKSLIRHIMLSDAYAQTSRDRPTAAAQDPANELYWRMNRRRLDFEALRDTLLSRTGNLDRSLYGASQKIDTTPFSHRRTVYAYIDRQNLPSLFRTFDLASPDTHNPRRAQTTVPQQGLFLLNSQFVAEQAESLAARLETVAAEHSPTEAIQELFQTVLGRSPQGDELSWFRQFLVEQAQTPQPERQERWQVGYGAFDPASQSLGDFRQLPFRSERGWQGGPQLPDEQLGWCLLTASGGHPGNSLGHAVVRRWLAPRDGVITVTGKLAHAAAEGDGVRGTLLANHHPLKQWTAQHSNTRTVVRNLNILQGQTVDFVTDCRSSPNHDSFEWKVVVRYTDRNEQYASEAGLPAKPQPPLGVWAQAVQALLLSNELIFID